MSDKTKRMRDDAEIMRRYDDLESRRAAKPKVTPTCGCGNTPLNAEMTILAHTHRGGISFYCLHCAPVDFLPYFRKQA